MRTRTRTRTRTLLALALATVLLAAGPVAAPAAQAATAGDDALCTVAYDLNQWSNGFVASVTVTNVSDVPVYWKVTVVLPSGDQVSQWWNVAVTRQGDTYVFEPPPEWWGPLPYLPPGQSVSFGFVGTGIGPLEITVACWPVT